VGVTTLEEVFLSVAKKGNKNQQQLAREASARRRASSAASLAESKSQSSDVSGTVRMLCGCSCYSHPRHIVVACSLRVACCIVACCLLLVALLLVACCLLRDACARLAVHSVACSFLSQPSKPLPPVLPGSNYHRAAADKNLFWRHFAALFVKRLKYTSRDRKAWVFQLLIPIAALVRVLFRVHIVCLFNARSRCGWCGKIYVPVVTPFTAAWTGSPQICNTIVPSSVSTVWCRGSAVDTNFLVCLASWDVSFFVGFCPGTHSLRSSST